MIIKVFHKNREPGETGFTHVADVNVEHLNELNAQLDYAYRWTNNIGGSWSRPMTFEDGMPNDDFNPHVKRLVPLHVYGERVYGLRSSMIGDVFERDGQKYVVATFGFEPVCEWPTMAERFA